MTNTSLHPLDRFFSKFLEQKFAAKQIIVHDHQSITSIYYLRKGYVRQYVISESGEELTIHIFRPGAYFPMMLVISEVSNHYYFQSLMDVKVNLVPADQVINFVKAHPKVLFNLTRSFAHGLLGLSTRLEYALQRNAYAQVAALLAYLSKTYGEKENGNVIVKIPLTHQDIADWLGLARETATRQIDKLQQLNLISYQESKLVINDLSGLQQAVLIKK